MPTTETNRNLTMGALHPITLTSGDTGTGAWGQADARLARAGHELRRLRYYRDLISEGFRAAQMADMSPRSLRAERIDLGISLPELDALPLWARRRDDGAISIPFVEFVLGQIAATLDAFAADLGDLATRTGLVEDRADLEMARQQANGGGAATALPRLGDTFLPEPFLAGLCGPRGLLDRLVARCEGLLAQI